ncbi:MAG: ATP-binding cassette domain-containing protein [Dehalococcoidia bacterium]|nr:ATP-binding cassette domain-containing protein [Dehalococcoidia bacterium]
MTTTVLAAPTESRLQSEAVTLAYGDATVARDLSVRIPDGRVTSIIGPNGCGKSTLLRALVRLLRPRGGTVYLDGQAIHRLGTKEVARRLGLLSQQSPLPEAITVEDLVRRGRFPHQSFLQPPSDRDHEAVERALALAGVEDLRDRPVDELSGGQRQRAWIAMTLAQETPILLLDEPTTFLDVAHQQEVFDLVRRLNREEGRTVVLVLHEVNDAARVSDHIVAMRDGAIVAEGVPEDVVNPEQLLTIFGVPCDVMCDPATAARTCIPRGCLLQPHITSARAGGVLRTSDLSSGYGDRRVVQGVNVDIAPGRITAIVGANACGKSTLLKTLARLLPITQGEALLDGRSVLEGRHRELACRLAMLGQGAVAPAGVTVEELVAAGRYPYQRWWRQWSPEDEAAVTRSLEATGLGALRHRQVETLSGGQRQRVWIAMTLAQDTPVMLLDEPTTFLDIAHQVEVLDLIADLNRREGRTIVMVLHDLAQAARYADEIVAMKDGEVIASGPPAEVITVDLVRTVFGIDCRVTPDPLTQRPVVLPALD